MTNLNELNEIVPEALVDERRRVSLVWLIPLVALIAAVWLGYRGYQQQGPLVSISFDSAEGLEAGKTAVRFKDVDVGVVEAIELTPDLSRVQLRARMVPGMAPFLNDAASFWVVRPRVSGGRVSGLATLLGGVHIGVDLAPGGTPQRSFTGREAPPVVTASEAGRLFTLEADGLGSLTEGAPVQYRGLAVGRVVSYALHGDGVQIRVFIDAPYDDRVGSRTRFWNISGVGLTLDASGVRLQTSSLSALLLGGIAFDLPAGEQRGAPAEAAAVFPLFATEQAAFERPTGQRELWQLGFAGSVRGLLPGAPVEFRGIRIGEVVDVSLQLDVLRPSSTIPVAIAIEPGRLGLRMRADAAGPGERSDQPREAWNRLVEHGLRAQLKSSNLLTGALYVDLDFYPDDAPQEIVWRGDTPRLPTVATPLDELRAVLTRIARLPLEQMGGDLSASLAALRGTMDATNELLRRLDRETATELSSTLQQTRSTLASLERLLAPNSPLQAEAQRALQEFSSAARSFRIMADYLERHPEALIRGKGGTAR